MKLFFAADHDVGLLAHFLRHYRELGFDEFLCSSTGTGLTDTGDLKVVEHVADATKSYFGSLQAAFSRLIKETPIGDSEWWGVAELDEFFDFGDQSPQSVIQKCEAFDCDVVFGKLVDRVAADGSLPELRPDVPLGTQFPAKSKITRNVIRGCRIKVMLCRGRKVIKGGNHGIHRPYHELGEAFVVYHYKWHANVLKRMVDRVALPSDEGNGWLAGNRRCLEHWATHKSVLV